jgi:hypothetical protein
MGCHNLNNPPNTVKLQLAPNIINTRDTSTSATNTSSSTTTTTTTTPAPAAAAAIR